MNQPDLSRPMSRADLDNAVRELKAEMRKAFGIASGECVGGEGVREKMTGLARDLSDLKNAMNRAFWRLTLAMILIAALAIIADRQF